MRTGWGTLACGIVVGAAAGFVCGHVAAWTQASARPAGQSPVAEWSAPADPFELPAFPDVDAEPQGPVFFPQHLHASRALAVPVQADAELAVGGEADEPTALPDPAEPATVSDEEQETLRAILDAELSHLSAGDREVWLDVLEGLPPADAVGIVRLWKRFGSGPAVADADPAAALPDLFSPSEVEPTPVSAAPVRDAAPLDATPTRLREARALVLQNLQNAGTFGYRRSEPIFSVAAQNSAEIYDAAVAPALAARLIGSRIDHTAGAIVETASPLDVAIEGEGFFVVKHPAGETFYTRCGRFSRDAAGRLALTTAQGDLPVEPEINVPGDAVALAVARDGEVSVQRDGGEPEVIGVAGLALFVAPAQLEATEDALFVASDGSGAAQVGRPGDGQRGVLSQRRLEGSNVDVARESGLLRQIDDWVRAGTGAGVAH